MTYTSFTIRHDKKNKRYRCEYTRKDGAWEGGGTWGHLYELNGVLVLMKHTTKPDAVFIDLAQFRQYIEQQYNITPKML